MLVVVSFLFVCCSSSPVLVHPPCGPIVGISDDIATSFLNIPFAEPPVGPLRFASPLPKQPWTAPIDASKFGPGCPQTCELPPLVCPTVTTEDCLQLNIFVPNNSTNSSLPVAVFLPGGNFRQGAASTLLYDARRWVAATPFVMVTVNYRLGALGFGLFEGVPRNLGIKDQRLALQWVRNNIAFFGGNVNQITLMGQSAGATSIGYHLLSSASAGLFSQVAAQSNPLALPLKNPEDGAKFAKVFLKHLGCHDKGCLMNANVSSIIEAQDETNKHFFPLDPLLLFYPWTPVVDEADGVTAQPIELLMEGKGRAVPGIFGTVANESVIFIYLAFGQGGMSEALYEAFLLDAFPLHFAQVKLHYPPSMGGNASMAASYLATDLLFTCATRAMIRAQAKNAPSFLYKFQHPLSFGKVAWGDATHCYNETCHAGELAFQFNPMPDLNISITAEEAVLSESMQKYWTNFFYSGNPSSPFSVSVPWPPYQASTDRDLRITTPAFFAESGLKKAECDFWDQIGYVHGNNLLKAISVFFSRSSV